MYAIVRTGGRQFRAEPGLVIDVERLPHEEGAEIELTDEQEAQLTAAVA